MVYLAQERGPRTGKWFVIGDVADTIEAAAAHIGTYANPDWETRIVVYFTPMTDENFDDRMVD